MTSLLAIGLAIISTIIGAFGALLFKTGSDHLHLNFKSLVFNWRLYLAVMLYGLATVFFIWALALKGSQLSILYPVVALSYVWVDLLSVKFLNEKLTIWSYGGIALIIIGVSFIGIGG